MEKSPKPDKFVPYNKRSKKLQRESDQKDRANWGGVRPVSQVFDNEKHYDRAKNRELIDGELTELDDETE